MVVTAPHMDLTKSIREYAETKMDKLPRYFDGIQSAEMVIDTEKEHSKVEIVITARKKHTFVAHDTAEDTYACIDKVIDKMSKQLRRHKDRVRDHTAKPAHEAIRGEE